ncbi:microneme [Cyclospora cayetanensis]|uniref:Microneme n=1 Tax=Cyclospora cayetanensis TaxID=88456 RepID=A0A1D3D7J9_9EIME|nr:microneme [Cyclospora cayetanensis]
MLNTRRGNALSVSESPQPVAQGWDVRQSAKPHALAASGIGSTDTFANDAASLATAPANGGTKAPIELLCSILLLRSPDASLGNNSNDDYRSDTAIEEAIQAALEVLLVLCEPSPLVAEVIEEEQKQQKAALLADLPAGSAFGSTLVEAAETEWSSVYETPVDLRRIFTGTAGGAALVLLLKLGSSHVQLDCLLLLRRMLLYGSSLERYEKQQQQESPQKPLAASELASAVAEACVQGGGCAQQLTKALKADGPTGEALRALVLQLLQELLQLSPPMRAACTIQGGLEALMKVLVDELNYPALSDLVQHLASEQQLLQGEAPPAAPTTPELHPSSASASSSGKRPAFESICKATKLLLQLLQQFIFCPAVPSKQDGGLSGLPFGFLRLQHHPATRPTAAAAAQAGVEAAGGKRGVSFAEFAKNCVALLRWGLPLGCCQFASEFVAALQELRQQRRQKGAQQHEEHQQEPLALLIHAALFSAGDLLLQKMLLSSVDLLLAGNDVLQRQLLQHILSAGAAASCISAVLALLLGVLCPPCIAFGAAVLSSSAASQQPASADLAPVIAPAAEFAAAVQVPLASLLLSPLALILQQSIEVLRQQEEATAADEEQHDSSAGCSNGSGFSANSTSAAQTLVATVGIEGLCQRLTDVLRTTGDLLPPAVCGLVRLLAIRGPRQLVKAFLSRCAAVPAQSPEAALLAQARQLIRWQQHTLESVRHNCAAAERHAALMQRAAAPELLAALAAEAATLGKEVEELLCARSAAAERAAAERQMAARETAELKAQLFALLLENAQQEQALEARNEQLVALQAQLEAKNTPPSANDVARLTAALAQREALLRRATEQQAELLSLLELIATRPQHHYNQQHQSNSRTDVAPGAPDAVHTAAVTQPTRAAVPSATTSACETASLDVSSCSRDQLQEGLHPNNLHSAVADPAAGAAASGGLQPCQGTHQHADRSDSKYVLERSVLQQGSKVQKQQQPQPEGHALEHHYYEQYLHAQVTHGQQQDHLLQMTQRPLLQPQQEHERSHRENPQHQDVSQLMYKTQHEQPYFAEYYATVARVDPSVLTPEQLEEFENFKREWEKYILHCKQIRYSSENNTGGTYHMAESPADFMRSPVAL